MNFYESLEKMLNSGLEDLWRNVGVMPKDKISWKPESTSRSARELLNEIVSASGYTIAVLQTRSSADDAYKSSEELSLSELQAAHREVTAVFIEEVKRFPEAELTDTVVLPWGELSYFDVISYVYWNQMYHLGQIVYIQTLYGDSEMH